MKNTLFDSTNSQTSRNVLLGEYDMKLINRLYKSEKDNSPLCRYCKSKAKREGRKFQVTCCNWMCVKKMKSDNAKSQFVNK